MSVLGPEQGGPWHENMWVYENRGVPQDRRLRTTHTQKSTENESFMLFVQEAVCKQFALMTDTADFLGDPVQIPEVSANNV